MKISIFTSMTNPEERMDPWKESLKCYEDFADEVVVVGEDWDYEFSWEKIGNVFQEGFDKSDGDWVIRMDLDYFFHEKDVDLFRETLKENIDSPALSFPKHQIFTPERYNLKSKICMAFNKKMYPNIKLNGGGDLCQPTLSGEEIKPIDVPEATMPIWNYDTVFRTKEIISEDRARFARAWNKYFNDWEKGKGTPEEAFRAWFKMIKKRYKKHKSLLDFSEHPKYIIDKLENLNPEQFGYNAFGLKEKYFGESS